MKDNIEQCPASLCGGTIHLRHCVIDRAGRIIKNTLRNKISRDKTAIRHLCNFQYIWIER